MPNVSSNNSSNSVNNTITRATHNNISQRRTPSLPSPVKFATNRTISSKRNPREPACRRCSVALRDFRSPGERAAVGKKEKPAARYAARSACENGRGIGSRRHLEFLLSDAEGSFPLVVSISSVIDSANTLLWPSSRDALETARDGARTPDPPRDIRRVSSSSGWSGGWIKRRERRDVTGQERGAGVRAS